MVTTLRPVLDEAEAGRLADLYDDRDPREVLQWAAETFDPDRLVLCTSFQVDGMVTLDMAQQIGVDLRIATIDTGRLPHETHDFIDQVRERYGVDIEIFTPAPEDVEPMVSEHGPNLFYRAESLRMLCCEVRKVRPLGRLLRRADGWIAGLRRDQASTRSGIRTIELDHEHDGIVKLNPLAAWTEAIVWDYARAHDVPTHPLYAQGYTSIGCAPCTRAVEPGEDPRAGRWWWESEAPKECGLHLPMVQNDQDATAEPLHASPPKSGELRLHTLY